MVGTGGGDLDGEAGLGLANDIGEVGIRWRFRHRCVDPALETRTIVEPLLQMTQGVHAEDLDTVHQAGLGEVADRNHHCRPPLPFGRQHRREHPVHRADATVERQFSQ